MGLNVKQKRFFLILTIQNICDVCHHLQYENLMTADNGTKNTATPTTSRSWNDIEVNF